MNEYYKVWGICEHPDWLRENAGTPDMPLSLVMSLAHAQQLARGLSLMAPAARFEVRDALGRVEDVYGPDRDEPVLPVLHVNRGRRTLGDRGR